VTALCQCSGNCGKPAKGKYAKSCYDRWRHAGFPETGPPPPLTKAEADAIRAANLKGPGYVPDAADLAEYAERRRQRDPDLRVMRMVPFAADWARSVQNRDALGVRVLVARLQRDPDSVVPLLIALGAVADLDELTGEQETA
jgi:hypothetical protein